ncbi:MAG: glycosyltransferase, partial [Planctomycetota bacterium]|nr:glycosyltransferase [Planctomycetota bacterium]
MTHLKTKSRGGKKLKSRRDRVTQTRSRKGQSSQSLTVLHSIAGAWLEPTQTWLYEQVRALPQDIENQIVCTHTSNLDQFPMDNLHADSDQSISRRLWERVQKKLGRQRASHLSFKVAKDTEAKILHSHFGYTAWRNLELARKANLRHVVTFYGLDVNYLPKHGWLPRYQELFAEIDLVLCEGPHMAKCIVDLGCDPQKVLVHHLGVNLERIPFQPCAWDPRVPLKCLIAASFREKKGIPYALEALGRIGEDFPIEVTIIGDASKSKASKSEKQKILETISKWDLYSRVRLLGYQP